MLATGYGVQDQSGEMIDVLAEHRKQLAHAQRGFALAPTAEIGDDGAHLSPPSGACCDLPREARAAANSTSGLRRVL